MYMYVCTVYITSKKTGVKTTVQGCRDGSEQKSYKLVPALEVVLLHRT